MPESDTPPVLEPEPLVPARGKGASLLDRWIAGDPEAAAARLESMVKALEQLQRAAIRATFASDWIIHTSHGPDGAVLRQVGYLQDCGAERAGKVWGIEVGNPAIEREDFADGTYCYHMLADAWSKVTGERLDYVEGSRWSGDQFFKRSVGAEDKIDPTDVRKSAYANLHGRAVRALSGLNGVPLDQLRAAGLDTSKVVTVSYERGAKGGESAGAAVGTDLVIQWGNAKGSKLGDLTDKDLAYYVQAHERDVTNPAKATYQRQNQRMLEALKAEQARRQASVAQEVETGTAANGRGRKLGDLHTRLLDAVKGNGRLVGGLLRALTKTHLGDDKSALSDLTDAELDQLNALADEDLAKHAPKS